MRTGRLFVLCLLRWYLKPASLMSSSCPAVLPWPVKACLAVLQRSGPPTDGPRGNAHALAQPRDEATRRHRRPWVREATGGHRHALCLLTRWWCRGRKRQGWLRQVVVDVRGSPVISRFGFDAPEQAASTRARGPDLKPGVDRRMVDLRTASTSSPPHFAPLTGALDGAATATTPPVGLRSRCPAGPPARPAGRQAELRRRSGLLTSAEAADPGGLHHGTEAWR